MVTPLLILAELNMLPSPVNGYDGTHIYTGTGKEYSSFVVNTESYFKSYKLESIHKRSEGTEDRQTQC